MWSPSLSFPWINSVSLFISHSFRDGVTGPAVGCLVAVGEIPLWGCSDFNLGEERGDIYQSYPHPSPEKGWGESGHTGFVKCMYYQLSWLPFVPLLFRFLISPSSRRHIPRKDGKWTTKIPSLLTHPPLRRFGLLWGGHLVNLVCAKFSLMSKDLLSFLAKNMPPCSF